jgi:hypothetical protein
MAASPAPATRPEPGSSWDEERGSFVASSSTPRQHRSANIAEQVVAVLLLRDASADDRLIRAFHSAVSDD